MNKQEHELSTLFPRGRWTTKKPEDSGLFSVLIGERWFSLPQQDLTERELSLLEMLGVELGVKRVDKLRQHACLEKMYQSSQLVSAIQLVYIHSRTEDLSQQREWLAFFSQLLPNYLTHFSNSPHEMVFVLNQEPFHDITSLLRDTLSAMEFDFGLPVSVVVGRVCSAKERIKWLDGYRREMELCQSWFSHQAKSALRTFSQILLWSIGQAGERFHTFQSDLRDSICQSHEMEEVVRVLWEEQAVLTKTAQRLYLHRNTLQYRLDRFQEKTGLSLRNMDDLTICYLALLS